MLWPQINLCLLLNVNQLCFDPTLLLDNCIVHPAFLCSRRWSNVGRRGCNCIYCVGSTQQQTPHEKAPQSPTDQDRVRWRDRARTESGACADVGRHPARGAADYNVLHRQDHQVSAGMWFCKLVFHSSSVGCASLLSLMTAGCYGMQHSRTGIKTTNLDFLVVLLVVVQPSSHLSPWCRCQTTKKSKGIGWRFNFIRRLILLWVMTHFCLHKGWYMCSAEVRLIFILVHCCAWRHLYSDAT